MIEKGEELWLMLIIHIINKRNDSVNVILFIIIIIIITIIIIIIISSYYLPYRVCPT